jgi:hypothetical protein
MRPRDIRRLKRAGMLGRCAGCNRRITQVRCALCYLLACRRCLQGRCCSVPF